MSPSPQRSNLALVAVFLLALAPAATAPAQDRTPVLTLESVHVEPASPGPDALCRLIVTLRSSGDRPASALEFAVKIDGREVPAYKDRLFLYAVGPGTTREIRLFNFWSTEPDRPTPAGDKLTLEVTLVRAAWMQKETKDGAEVWTALGPVENLPVAKTISVKLGKR
jgi:hypothetical protein